VAEDLVTALGEGWLSQVVDVSHLEVVDSAAAGAHQMRVGIRDVGVVAVRPVAELQLKNLVESLEGVDRLVDRRGLIIGYSGWSRW